jgi:hypothetical protein
MTVLLLFFLYSVGIVSGFQPSILSAHKVGTKQLSMSTFDFDTGISFVKAANMLLADTSISEEDVMAVTGAASDLPNPLYAVGFAFVIFGGVAALQLSLGDLTTEEGQARVKDYLQTKRDTERKRGYFD